MGTTILQRETGKKVLNSLFLKNSFDSSERRGLKDTLQWGGGGDKDYLNS